MIFANDTVYRRSSGGLGTSSIEQNKGFISAGLNFIPGVGPILSGIFNLAESIFGGGDPTPMATYFAAIIQMRLQVAQAHRVLGVPDDFHLPTGFDGSPDQIDDLAMLIINDELGKVPSVHMSDVILDDWTGVGASLSLPGRPVATIWPVYAGASERENVTNVVKKLQGELQTLGLEATSASLAPPPAPLPPPAGAPATDPTQDPSMSTSSPADAATAPAADVNVASLETMGPWLLGGTAAIVALGALIASRRK